MRIKLKVKRSLIKIGKIGTKRTLVWILWNGLYWDLLRIFVVTFDLCIYELQGINSGANMLSLSHIRIRWFLDVIIYALIFLRI